MLRGALISTQHSPRHVSPAQRLSHHLSLPGKQQIWNRSGRTILGLHRVDQGDVLLLRVGGLDALVDNLLPRAALGLALLCRTTSVSLFSLGLLACFANNFQWFLETLFFFLACGLESFFDVPRGQTCRGLGSTRWVGPGCLA